MPNKPKILSNELDQVAKKGERYRQELLKEQLLDQIIEAFNKTEELSSPMGENDFFIDDKTDKSVLDRFFINNKYLPMEQVGKFLKEKAVVSCELFREKKEKTGGWNTTIGPAVPKDTIPFGTVLTQKDIPIDGYDITYITFTKIRTEGWPYVKISLQQVGFPGEGAMIPKYIVFHNELKGKNVDKIKNIPIGSIV